MSEGDPGPRSNASLCQATEPPRRSKATTPRPLPPKGRMIVSSKAIGLDANAL